MTAYNNGKTIDSLPNYRFITYNIQPNKYPTYLKITANKEAYIPIKSYTSQEYNKHEYIHTLLVGLFYGFTLMVIIVNLFYYPNPDIEKSKQAESLGV